MLSWENNNYKDKDVIDIYIRYRQLFGDTFDSDKYAVTPTKLCRTGFELFEDSCMEDFRDAIPVHDESSDSSDEEQDVKGKLSMSISGAYSGEKFKSTSGKQKGKKKKKLTSRKFSYSVDRARSAVEIVSAKINNIIRPTKNDIKACLEKLLVTGRLKRKTEMFHYVSMLISCKNTRDMLEVMMDADENMDYVEWVFTDHKKGPNESNP